MATGYTAPIHDGENITFEQFALRCARAFGALITMRDDPLNAPIPTRINPDVSYYKEVLARSRCELKRISAMTTDQARKASTNEWRQAGKRRIECIVDNNDVRYRYEQMLKQVMRWDPPTGDHVGLKEFMIEQLRTSIEFDSYAQEPHPKRPIPPVRWKKQRVARIEQDIEYYERLMAEEIERARARTGYIQNLLESLGIDFTDEPISVH